MRRRFMSPIIALLAVVAFSFLTLAQTAPQPGTANPNPQAPAPAHDLSGVWLFDTDRYHASFNKPGLYGLSTRQAPPMTPWAQERYNAAKPGSRAALGQTTMIQPCTVIHRACRASWAPDHLRSFRFPAGF